MPNASGLVYTGPNGVSGIIESIVYTEIRRPLASSYDAEDLKQEMRMAAIKAMPKYDAARIGPSPFKFLQQCVRNHVYNLNRGVHVPNNPPCVRCELWDKLNKVCVIAEEGCEAIVKYRENMRTKASLRKPDRLPDFDLRHTTNDIEAFILDDSIRVRLPPELLVDYNRLLAGEPVESRRKSRIRRVIKELLEDN